MSYSRIFWTVHVISMNSMRIWLLIFNKWFHVVAFIPLFVVNWFTHVKVRAAVLVAAVVLSLLSIKVNIGQYSTDHYYDWHEKEGLPWKIKPVDTEHLLKKCIFFFAFTFSFAYLFPPISLLFAQITHHELFTSLLALLKVLFSTLV